MRRSRSCRSGCSRSPVFTVCCVLRFIVGFAMLGALTFLPTFMQFVDGVSATSPGCGHCRWSRACSSPRSAAASSSSRTGRYKIFPVAGTAVMAVGFVLLSRMDAATPMLAAVAVPVRPRHRHRPVHAGAHPDRAEHLELRRPRRRDVGRHVLPHHRKFVRRSHLRLAVRQLPRRPHRAGARGQRRAAARRGVTAGAARAVAADAPRRSSTPTPTRSGMVFLCAAPVAVVGFIVALFLKEVPLREMEAVSPSISARASACPSTESPEKILESRHRPDVPRLAGHPAAQPRADSPAANSTSPSCGRCCRSTGRTRCSARRR